MATLNQNIDSIYDQIAEFERGSKAFSVEALTQSLRGVLSAFELLRNQPELGEAADNALYGRLRDVEPNQSTLRFLTSHILGIYLEAWAHGPSGFRRSYQELLRFRPDEARVDADYIERVLIDRLLVLKELGGRDDLGYNLLIELSNYMQTFGGPPSLPQRPTAKDLQKLPLGQVLLGLGRRRVAFPSKDLTEAQDAWEYGLKREKYFEWLRDQGRRQKLDVEPYLVRLGLLKRVSWWQRFLAALAAFFKAIGAALGAAFGKLPAGGLVWSVFMIALVILAVVVLPVFWIIHYDHQVKKFNQESSDVATRPMVAPK